MAIRKLKNLLLLCGVILISFMPLIINASNFLPEITDRALQYVEYSTKGIYYLIEFPKNNITGTGDKLQDVPYKTLCVIKACENSCCTGDIENMKCGTAEECKTYFDSTRKGNVAAAVIIPISVIIIFLVTFFLLWKKFKVSSCLSALLAFICMFVITIPLVIWYVKKYNPLTESNADKITEKKLLYKEGKEVELKNDADKIILSDNKKVADTEKFSANNYNKLSADDDSNKNLNIISISNKNQNGQNKRENMPDIVFDENLKDEQGSHHSYTKQKSNNDYNDDLSQEKLRRNNSDPNGDEDKDKNENNEEDALEKSQHSEAKSKKSEQNASRYSRHESNANKSVKSYNKSRNEGETPEEENQGNVSIKDHEEGLNNDENNENPVDKDEQLAEPKEAENNDVDAEKIDNEENKENAEENKEDVAAGENENDEVNPVEDA